MVVIAAGCQQEAAPPGQSVAVSVPALSAPAINAITKIVFIGKANACDCTRKRIDDSYAALQTAIEGRSDITLEPLQVDVDESAVEKYAALRPIMVLPAIYLLNGRGSVIDMLQGEVTVQQFRTAIRPR